MQDITAIRLVENRLAWYPPGTSDEPEWLDEEGAGDRLRAALGQRRGGICFAAPGADTRLLTLAVTPAEKKHISKSLPFTLEEQVAADIDDLHFAHGAVDRENLGVAICSRDKMADWRELLAPFPGVNRWSPEPLMLPWREGEWCLVLEDDNAILRSGRCEGVSIERAMLPVILDGMLREGGAPRTLVVYGDDQDADLALLPEALRECAQWRRGNFAAAMLLAEGEQISLNLLQGEYAARLPLRRWWQQWRLVAVAFAAAFTLQLGALYVDYRELQAENLALRGAVQDSYRQAFPKGQVVDPEKQLQRQLDALRGTAQTSGFVALIERVGQAVAAMPSTTIATLNYNDKADEMRLNVVAKNFEGVEQLRSKINETGLQATMENSSAQGDEVRARLRIGGGIR